MKNTEAAIREILYNAIEKDNRTLTQSAVAKKLKISLSTVNKTVKNLEKMGSISVKQRNFCVVDIKKILYYWASIRNIQKDIIYSTRVDSPVAEIEKSMPDDIVFSAYTAYKLLYNDVPADYSEVYIYGDENIKKRFPTKKGTPNLIVLKKDKNIDNYGKTTTTANTFVDLWNIKEWYAKEFIKAIEARLYGILE